MTRVKTLLRALAFLALFGILLLQVQGLVTPTWDWPSHSERVLKSVRGVFAEPDNSIDVLWMGSSYMLFGVSPINFYKNTGIRSYNIGSPNQSLPLSYEYAKVVMEKQHPKLAFVDVGSLFKTQKDYRNPTLWRKIIDSLPTSKIVGKLSMTARMESLKGSMVDVEKAAQAIFPVLRYHANYVLDESNYYNYHVEQPYFLKGHGITTKVAAAKANDEDVIDKKMMKKLRSYASVAAEYLDLLKKLCEDHGCELVMVKIPIKRLKSYASHWGIEKHTIAKELADERGLEFIDLNYEDTGIDWKMDTCDDGLHLNESGSLKVTNYLSDWVQQNRPIESTSNNMWTASWNKQVDLHDSEMRFYGLQMEYDLAEYLKQLEGKNYTLLMTVSGGVGKYWSQQDQQALSLATGAAEDMTQNADMAYVLVASAGQTEIEAKQAGSCSASGVLADGVEYQITGIADSSAKSSITVEGTEMICDGTGIQLVVYDNDLHCVIDSVLFNTHKQARNASHKNTSYRRSFRTSLMQYENEAMTGI